MNLTSNELDTLVAQHIPRFILSVGERDYPSSIEKFLTHCNVVSETDATVLLEGPLTVSGLESWSSTFSGDWDTVTLSPVIDAEGFFATPFDPNAPIYCNVFPHSENPTTVLVINYCLFFHNNKGKVFSVGAHVADIEHVSVEIDIGTGDAIRYYFGRHGQEEGAWIEADDAELTKTDDGRVHVYCARGSHGFYHEGGQQTFSRFYGFGNDVVSSDEGRHLGDDTATVLDTADGVLDVSAPDPHAFLAFQGDLGDGHVTNFTAKAWWQDETANGDTMRVLPTETTITKWMNSLPFIGLCLILVIFMAVTYKMPKSGLMKKGVVGFVGLTILALLAITGLKFYDGVVCCDMYI